MCITAKAQIFSLRCCNLIVYTISEYLNYPFAKECDDIKFKITHSLIPQP